MLVEETIANIRREQFNEGKSIKQICLSYGYLAIRCARSSDPGRPSSSMTAQRSPGRRLIPGGRNWTSCRPRTRVD